MSENTKNNTITLLNHNLPVMIYIIPLLEKPFFPPQNLPIILEKSSFENSIKKIHESEHQVGGFLLCKEKKTPKKLSDFYAIGTSFKLHNPISVNHKIQIVAQGIRKFKIIRWISKREPFLAQVEYLPDPIHVETPYIRAYVLSIINAIKKLIPLNPLYHEELKYFLSRFLNSEPSYFADFAASLTTSSKEELQSVLECLDLKKKLELVLSLVKKEHDIVKLEAKIHHEVEQNISIHQREFFLKEQLKAIQQELGLAKDDKTAERERFDERIQKINLSESAQETILEELEKLSVLELGSPEYAVTRNYLDIVTSLPWGIYSKDKTNLTYAKKILNQEHESLEDIKTRILEFIAVGALKGEIAGTILLLVGPPGVGKTSIGRSIAQALGREFFRFSVGGMRDEAEIKGHRRTYIGAMPGKFLRALIAVETANPVIMLDEIDKIGASFHGDPASALLEVLDPEQNCDFLDHYLDLRFDLSKIFFICTANQLDTIPKALLDRMEIVHLAGYITAEKMDIARKHLWPRLVQRAGLKNTQIRLSRPALQKVIEDYAREAGVRNLEQQLAKMTRKAAVQIVTQKTEKIQINIKDIHKYLGEPLFPPEELIDGVGVVTGLAWTALGGATLTVEASRIHHHQRGLRVTGCLGEVMKESAEIACNYIASHLKQYDAPVEYFDQAFIHLHVPEGATPKDGPSAGITLACALLSLARNVAIRHHLAMSGELTLTGQVLPVGGIREKIVAAVRSNMKEVILPFSVQKDIRELPKYLIDDLTLYYVKHFDEVVRIVFDA
jgi:ATP-dependent Lon protease